MFTGIIETTAKIDALTGNALTLANPWPAAELTIGQSVAVDGCCLTVTALGGATIVFQISPETFSRTGFRAKRAGDAVNLERALRLGDRLDGHVVTGHVDALATVTEVRAQDGCKVAWFEVAPSLGAWIVPKGSIALDGVSLTVNDVDGARFSVTWIAHTLAVTTLDRLAAGDRVNAEFDVLGKYVQRNLEFLQTNRGGSRA